MNYLWEEFNIKTFPAETIVFRDGIFQSKLSTLDSLDIDKKYDKPIHIIYVGQILAENDLHINVSVPEQSVFLTVKIENKKPAFLNIYIKNTGKNSSVHGNILIQNHNELKLYKKATHLDDNTTIILKTRLIAHKNSNSKLIGFAEIEKNMKNCDSDVGFSVLAAPDAKIEFFPAQYISAIPNNAEHSAALYKAAAAQLEYLKESGLSDIEIKEILQEAFFNNDLLF